MHALKHHICTPATHTQVRKHFPSFPERSPSDLFAAINVIKDPSFIRVESDEVRVA